MSNIKGGEYAQYWKKLMQHYVANSTKNVIILAHTSDIMNEAEMAMETKVKVKGSLMNQGIESYFSCVISTKKVSIKQLKVSNPLLNITDQDERKGFKYVFQTDLTSDTVGESIRSPMYMWEENEIYIDNNAQHVLDKLTWFYGD